jgi:hypothetical protein
MPATSSRSSRRPDSPRPVPICLKPLAYSESHVESITCKWVPKSKVGRGRKSTGFPVAFQAFVLFYCTSAGQGSGRQ